MATSANNGGLIILYPPFNNEQLVFHDLILVASGFCSKFERCDERPDKESLLQNIQTRFYLEHAHILEKKLNVLFSQILHSVLCR